MTKDRFSKWPLSKSQKSPRSMIQVPLRTVSKLCCRLLRTVTFCWVNPVLLRPARFLIRTVTAVANLLTVLKSGTAVTASLSIPPPCVAPRPSRFLHGGLKRGRREPSVNVA